ncbi:MAG: isoprenylcysteine carboxylmethyltransferase family protein [bacterium]|nr:isoprenylcysteine carboxylmethyltransferase family protein [bacterium]
MATSSSRKVRIPSTLLGATIFFSIIIGLFILFFKLGEWLQFPDFLPADWNRIISLPFILIGLFFILWSNLSFLQAKGTPVPLNPPPNLVTTGPYAYTRNPMLTGMFFLIFALGLWFNSISVSFIFTPLFIALNVIQIKMIEEPELEKRLGQNYLDYKNQVPMFFPRLRPRPKNKNL